MQRLRLAIVAIAACLAAAGPAVAADDNGTGAPVHTNRLIDSNNPYLLLHAHNPVDWYPWGPEAFARAKAENKPIFLSVGYSTCYWCHVADRTIFSDPDIAALMNQWFVNVKVDSEQRGDVDRIYMLARNILSETAGWPNNVFLTPDLKPFFAWGYLTPEDDPSGAAGFVTVLRRVHEGWTERQDRLTGLAELVFIAMQEAQRTMTESTEQPITPSAWMALARQNWLEAFDPVYGGLVGHAGPNKFPLATNLAMLIADYRLHADKQSLQALRRTLDAMALGGIYDQIAGGFHRYSVDRAWSVPHFEKMLYDNAQLLAIYADAYQLTGQELYRTIARETGDFVLDHMTAANGGFYTALDAQIDGVEGVSYVWSADEIFANLPSDDALAFFKFYALYPIPDPLGRHTESLVETGVPRVQIGDGDNPIAAALDGLLTRRAQFAESRRILKAARDRRPQPMRDDKFLVALNGLAIDAFARGAAILDRPEYLVAATKAAERVWRAAFDTETRRLAHEVYNGRAQGDAFLADYALFGVGLMTLASVTGDPTWRGRAKMMADAILAQFVAPTGRLSSALAGDDILFPVEDIGDDIHPSGTSAAIDLLLRLGAEPADARYADRARRIVRLMGGQIQSRPAAWASLLTALAAAGVRDESPAEIAADADAAPALAALVPSTADKVAVAVARDPGADAITVTLDIAAGFHVNANPASLDFLIPTQVAFDGLEAVDITYPPAVAFDPEFVAEPLDVYEGTVVIDVRTEPGVLATDQAITGTLTAQACDAHVCLPPADIPLRID